MEDGEEVVVVEEEVMAAEVEVVEAAMEAKPVNFEDLSKVVLVLHTNET